ncbi:hypothetical protein ANO14919_108130 [Xylariales sp. No.14919]|nr:hypothetical protein ANO14919_108130 [Xylariales sp. No.14919]
MFLQPLVINLIILVKTVEKGTLRLSGTYLDIKPPPTSFQTFNSLVEADFTWKSIALLRDASKSASRNSSAHPLGASTSRLKYITRSTAPTLSPTEPTTSASSIPASAKIRHFLREQLGSISTRKL